ncbi:MAG: hypothetical protein HUU09_10085 [Candidatus Jettenia caeni]|uniref:hypothetical protein n=1 Tax=Candidatus Jettenia sp. AMX1 TaxID=2293637 RepID=UPI0017CED6B9|nr:hypothetical protein [Candidatus Jettenia sp. AMX1]NUN23802.1 hypothetical protein [Candidatus Jettenia caeni]MDL1938093.1 hypothetical protein [Candidatus Jettenia sp. AMX1]WKZ16750.1 MAG: hypothetical protein QY317_05440 [Candidatus Jettenia caeni]GIL20868.1 MAG: hypothetical protein BroJett041_19820 [Candidatus Jettenia caeni]GJQ44678.1 MAG: hypothetical protein JETCAE04_04320 [Candidatus Jettenia caeni]
MTQNKGKTVRCRDEPCVFALANQCHYDAMVDSLRVIHPTGNSTNEGGLSKANPPKVAKASPYRYK